jgi:hypothetical protein
MTERAWWNTVADPGDDFDLSHLDYDLQAAFDELHHPDPQLIVRTLYGNRPEVPHWHYQPLVRRARQRWWPHLDWSPGCVARAVDRHTCERSPPPGIVP